MDKPIDTTKEGSDSKRKCCGGRAKDGTKTPKRYTKEGDRVMLLSTACCRNGQNWKYRRWSKDPALGIYYSEGTPMPPDILAKLPMPKWGVNKKGIEIDENGEPIKFPKEKKT